MQELGNREQQLYLAVSRRTDPPGTNNHGASAKRDESHIRCLIQFQPESGQTMSGFAL